MDFKQALDSKIADSTHFTKHGVPVNYQLKPYVPMHVSMVLLSLHCRRGGRHSTMPKPQRKRPSTSTCGLTSLPGLTPLLLKHKFHR